MFGLSGSELLFYGGIVVMVMAVVFAVVCIVVFLFSGKRLKKILEQEYGKPRR